MNLDDPMGEEKEVLMRNYNDYRQKDSSVYDIFELAKKGDLELLLAEQTLNPLANLNAKDHKGYSPLMYAAYYNHLPLVKWLISQGADVESPDRGGSTILMGVAFKGHLEVAETLIEAGASVSALNDAHMTPLNFAEMFGRKEMATLLNGSRDGFLKRQISTWFLYLSRKMQMKRSSSYEI